MSRKLTARSTLESLKKEAKRWLRALQAGDAVARRRLLAATPAAPAEPGLRDVQFALAREYDAKYGRIRFLSGPGHAETVWKFPATSGDACKTHSPTPPKSAKVELS